MTASYRGSEELLARTGDFIADHRDLYLSSGGVHGHVMNFAHVGVDKYLPSLLLQTAGRKSGRKSIVPLIYGFHDGEWVVVASKGGAPDHPAWFLNLKQMERATIQIATQPYIADWKNLEDEEYERVWDYMAGIFPPYLDYRKAVAGIRTIPLVSIRPLESTALLAND